MNWRIEALARHVARKAVCDHAKGQAKDPRELWEAQSMTAQTVAVLAEHWLKDHPEIRDQVKIRYADLIK